MTATLAAALAIFAVSPPVDEPFAFSNLTVTDLGRADSTTDYRRIRYIRVVATMSDGSSTDIYVSSLVLDRRPPRVGDICDFSGSVRPWIRGKEKPGPYDPIWNPDNPAPPDGARLMMADRYSCRTGPDAVASPNQTVVDSLPSYQTSTVTVVGVGPKPEWASGVMMTNILILGRSEGGDIDPFYLIYFGDEEPVPPVGSVCTIKHSPMPLSYVGGMAVQSGSIGEAFESFDCIPALEP